MRTVTKEIEVYSFDELSKGAQEKALEQCADIHVDYYWAEVTIWNAKDKLAEMGFEDAEILYSGFYSQGDGASFTARVNLNKWLAAQSASVRKSFAKFKDGDYPVSITVSGNNINVHEMTMGVEYDWVYNDLSDNDAMAFDKMAELILEDARSEARLIYKQLQDEYEYRTSREAIIEGIVENEIEFEKNGKVVNL